MSPAFLLRAVLFVTLACALFLPASAPAADAGFRRFADTISPNDVYVFAWGTGSESDLPTLKEWAPGADAAEDSVFNYLVDAGAGKVLAVIPEMDHFITTDGRAKRFSGLAVNWSADSRAAIAIYEGRWSSEAVLWVDPEAKKFTDLLPALVRTYSRFLKEKKKVEDPGEVAFSMPAILPGPVLVIDGRARPSLTHGPEYNFTLRLQVKFGDKEPRLNLLKATPAPDGPPDEKVEDELNRAYQQLRSKLGESARTTLKEQQLAWLKQREALPQGERVFFTRLRTATLRASLYD